MIDWGPKPFRNLDAWFSHDGFIKLVKEEWRSLDDTPLLEKSKALKCPLRIWNKKEFGSIDEKIGALEAEVALIDRDAKIEMLEET